MTESPGSEIIGNRRSEPAGISPEIRTVANELAMSAQAVAGTVMGGLILLAFTMTLAATGYMYEISEGWILVCIGLALACGVLTPTAIRLLGDRVARLRGSQPDRLRHQGAEGSDLLRSEAGLLEGHAERQLLEAIERHGEITPARAALETPLTVAEADRMLSELAKGGYLEVRVEGGKLLYGL